MLPSLQNLVRTPYFDNYLKHLETDELFAALTDSAEYFVRLLESIPNDLWRYRYAPEKWTIEEVVLHTIETELIFNSRALRIAREETNQMLDGFDENAYVVQTKLGGMSPTEIIDYFKAVRTSTTMMAKTFSERQLEKVGVASGNRVQVSALFFVTAGHTIHHGKVLQERYLSK